MVCGNTSLYMQELNLIPWTSKKNLVPRKYMFHCSLFIMVMPLRHYMKMHPFPFYSFYHLHLKCPLLASCGLSLCRLVSSSPSHSLYCPCILCAIVLVRHAPTLAFVRYMYIFWACLASGRCSSI